MNNVLFLVVPLLVIAIGVALMMTMHRRRRLSPAFVAELQRHWKAATSQKDPQRRVLDAEKVLDRLLRARGYRGSFGDMLKRAGSRLPNINAVWQAHKLRNRIAHEPGITVSDREAGSALSAFEQAMKSLL